MNEAMVGANDAQARYWSDLAPTWLEAEEAFERVGEGPGLLAMERLGAQPDDRVLDIGCGSGRTTLLLGLAVAPGGHAVGVDIADELLVPARERALARGFRNVTFVHADAQTHPFDEGAFDGAYSRFGTMFFADAVAAFANIRRALRPGAALSFACWQHVLANEWVVVPALAAATVLGTMPQPPAVGEAGPFSLAEPEVVRDVLDTAGFGQLDIVRHADEVVVDERDIPELAAASIRLGAVREMLREAGGQHESAVREAIHAALCERVSDGQVRLSRAVLLVTARA